MERLVQENTAARWFCGFNLKNNTPDSVFSQTRKKIGTKILPKIFAGLREQLKRQGLMSEVFIFVGTVYLIAKANLWEERDKAIQKKYEKLNADVQVKIGCIGEAPRVSKARGNHLAEIRKNKMKSKNKDQDWLV